ncbi:PREDICTED: cytochrome P450 6k1-like [Nicrophorus vespilloides]|uniref:Cytochrome P450 6k1-like n=1 Tax=Nicrophorus vespilloides TaxID=110193 RepID=A0ABM1NEG9_NICVS|nr:PREDICTED: cytochrome P450 6k1-like [Nicrophorus vespilloides]
MEIAGDNGEIVRGIWRPYRSRRKKNQAPRSWGGVRGGPDGWNGDGDEARSGQMRMGQRRTCLLPGRRTSPQDTIRRLSCTQDEYITQSYDHWRKRGIPYVRPSFPFGNIYPLVSLKKCYGDILAQLHNSSKGPVVGYWAINNPFLLIRSPELIKNILVKDFNHFSERAVSSNNHDRIFNDMLFSMHFHDWKILRTKLTPLFTTTKLKYVMHIFRESAQEMIDYLEEVSGDAVDCKQISSQLTTNIFVGTGFGYKINCFKEVDNLFFISSIVKFNVFTEDFLDFYRFHFWKVIKDREESGVKYNDFIDCYIQLKNEGDLGDGITLDGDKLMAQAIQFFMAGFETTSSLIAFTLYELAMNEEIQDKLRFEVVDALKKEADGNFGYENIANLSYLSKVMSEAARKYPTLPFLERICVKDYQIPETDIVLDKGTKCQFSTLGIHYDPEYFPNPDIFDPERFSPEGIQSRPAYVYMPFGHGPHNCIGKRFGLLTAKMCIAQILIKFQIKPTESTPTKIKLHSKSFIIKPQDVFLKFVKF